MIRNILPILLALLVPALLPSPGPAAAGKILWVSAAGARLKTDKSATSPTVAELPMGERLAVEAADGKWYRVTAADTGDTGWIYRGKVAEAPPEDPGALPDDLLGDLGDSGILLAAADTSRSIRGLRTVEEKTRKKAVIDPEYLEALDRVLGFYTDEASVEGFLREGGIGEYAP